MNEEITQVAALEELDRVIGAGSETALAAKYEERGNLRVNLGSPKTGLEDLLRAYALRAIPKEIDAWERKLKKKLRESDLKTLESLLPDRYFELASLKRIPSSLQAKLGEAFRIYARDFLLSTPTKELNKSEVLISTLKRSVNCFDAALSSLGTSAPNVRAWLLAHRGAAYTLVYWLASDVKDPTALTAFEQADADFSAALAEGPDYPWCQQFQAYLYALRGGGRDWQLVRVPARNEKGSSYFRRARELLRRARRDSAVQQVFEHRHKAMLYSYDAHDEAKPDAQESTVRPTIEMKERFAQERIDAARLSISEALEAVRQDPDEFLASYFGTVSAWALSREGRPDVAAAYKEGLGAAIDGARTRSRNALSQALASLVGLELLESIRAGESGDEQAREACIGRANALRQVLLTFPPDLETLSIFRRDPVYSWFEKYCKAKNRDSGDEQSLYRENILESLKLPKIDFAGTFPNLAAEKASHGPAATEKTA